MISYMIPLNVSNLFPFKNYINHPTFRQPLLNNTLILTVTNQVIKTADLSSIFAL